MPLPSFRSTSNFWASETSPLARLWHLEVSWHQRQTPQTLESYRGFKQLKQAACGSCLVLTACPETCAGIQTCCSRWGSVWDPVVSPRLELCGRTSMRAWKCCAFPGTVEKAPLLRLHGRRAWTEVARAQSAPKASHRDGDRGTCHHHCVGFESV